MRLSILRAASTKFPDAVNLHQPSSKGMWAVTRNVDPTTPAVTAQLASWAGVCPGNNESGGKRKSGKTRKGSVWLRRALCEAAWAASRTKNTYLSAQYRRIAAKRGQKRASLAVAHTILVIAYHLLKNKVRYHELGGDYFDRIRTAGLKRYYLRRLEQLGVSVTESPTALDS